MTIPAPAPDVAGRTALHAHAARLTVVYDGDCGVCRETVRHLARWDRGVRLDFIPLARAAGSGQPVLEELAADEHAAESVHVVNLATGQVVSGGHAALAVIDALPGGWLFRPWSTLPSTTIAADVVYRVAARHRDRVAWLIGMRDEIACPMPGRDTGA